jgi:branched-chain amino acid transport system permease protein
MPVVQIPNGLHIAYREQGSGDRVVLFIHGNWASSRWFEKVFAHLPAGVRAIAPDLRGCGGTDKPGDPWCMADLAEDLSQLAGSLGVARCAVVGHSLGASVAMQLAVSQPQLVNRLLLINGAPVDGLGLDAATLGQVAALTRAPDVARMALGAMMPTAPKDELYQLLLDDAVTNSVGAVVRHTEALESMNLVAAAAALPIPVLIIHGAMDPLITRELAERCHAQVGGSVLEEWADVGHSAPVEAPERLAHRLGEFLG